MRHAIAVAITLTFSVSARSLPAQRWCNSPGAEPAPYSACALRLDGDYLVRGAYHETVAMADPFSVPLRHFVSGDSAMKYAARYERDAWRSGTLRLIGDLVLMIGSFRTLAQRQPSPVGGMTVGRTGPLMMLSGASVHLLSIPFRMKASEEAERAITWNNAALRREP